MTQIRSLLLTTALAIGGAWACTDPLSFDERAQEAFGGRLEFAVYEELGSPAPAAPQPTLVVRTVSHFAVSAQLDADYEVVDGGVVVRVREVVNRSCYMPCISIAITPDIRVPLPFSGGIHTLRFEVLGRTEEYLLTVTEDALRVSSSGPAVVERVVTPVHDAIWRIPARSLSLSCSSEPDARCDALLAMLIDEVDLEVGEFPEGAIPAWAYGPYFSYAVEADFGRLKDATCDFARRLAASDRISVHAVNWLGVTSRVLRYSGREATCE